MSTFIQFITQLPLKYQKFYILMSAYQASMNDTLNESIISKLFETEILRLINVKPVRRVNDLSAIDEQLDAKLGKWVTTSSSSTD